MNDTTDVSGIAVYITSHTREVVAAIGTLVSFAAAIIYRWRKRNGRP